MAWFSAHALLYFEYMEGEQSDYLVWENIYLVNASSPEEAKQRGESLAKLEQSKPGESITLDGRPVRLLFCSIRKVVECCQGLGMEGDTPGDGTEVSYSKFVALNREEFEKLVRGESASVVYKGRDDDEEQDEKG